jgi:ribosomal protein S18 acetylase RimI-like enzyme
MNRMASETDLPFLRSLSPKLSDSVLQKQVRDGRLRIIEIGDQPIGILKFYVLWETLPFIEVILLRESMRHRGYGTEAVRAWEQEMVERGFDIVLISTLANETAQHFWRKLGYVDCGSFSVRNKP